MKATVWSLVALLALVLAAGTARAQAAQDPLRGYQRNFVIGSLEMKIQILQDTGKSASRELGPLYLQAVDFVLANHPLLADEPRYRVLAVSALDLLRAAGFSAARDSVWDLFATDGSSEVRAACLRCLGVIARGDPGIVRNINLWLQSQNAALQAGQAPDEAVAAAAVQALSALGDPSSFAILFSTMNLRYSAETTGLAREALQSIPGDYPALFLEVMRNSPLPEKLAALELALGAGRLSESDKGRIAESALEAGLHSAAEDGPSRTAARELRFLAARALSQRTWSKATPLAIEHFDAVLLEYERGQTDRQYFLEAVELLGNCGTHEAAVRLTQYLILLNAYTERLRQSDGEIVLAVIQGLGKLGDKVAFDDLMHVEYLDYSIEIKAAARKVRSSLRW